MSKHMPTKKRGNAKTPEPVVWYGEDCGPSLDVVLDRLAAELGIITDKEAANTPETTVCRVDALHANIFIDNNGKFLGHTWLPEPEIFAKDFDLQTKARLLRKLRGSKAKTRRVGNDLIIEVEPRVAADYSPVQGA